MAQANAQPRRVGKRWLIVPPGADMPEDAGVIPVCVDAGEAFGDGSHPTTRMCLVALEHIVRPGMTAVDLGTGTGILAIAVAKMGAAHILGVDIESKAVQRARENAKANDVADRIAVEEGSLDTVLAMPQAVPASLVIANILASVIVEFFERGLTRVIAPGGWLVLSGILRAQTPDIYARLTWHGLERIAQEQTEEWVCIIARRPAV